MLHVAVGAAENEHCAARAVPSMPPIMRLCSGAAGKRTKRTRGCYRHVGQVLTILFVEDDRQVRTVVTETLAERGFRVLTTDDGNEALRLLGQEQVDVLFSDVVMPGLDGVELARRAQRLRPRLKVMLATGYFSRAKEAESVAKLLFKPLRADQIEAEVRQLVAAG